jgi:Mannosylglycerate hydrolase MGH1-like glycoside hydrolase domain
LRVPDTFATRLKVRTLVGLLPVCASLVITQGEYNRLPHFFEQRSAWLSRRYPEVTCNLTNLDKAGYVGSRMLSVITPEKLRRILSRMLDPKEFLSDYGIRSLSREYKDKPFDLRIRDATYSVTYEPAESSSGVFGGNSNWRGPIWFPINFMLVYALYRWYSYLGPAFKIECPTGSGHSMNLREVSDMLARRLVKLFSRENGRRPVHGGSDKFQNDPHWRDLLLFYEYFHGDNGPGIGASHQTGWTGLVARLVQLTAHGSSNSPTNPRDLLWTGVQQKRR